MRFYTIHRTVFLSILGGKGGAGGHGIFTRHPLGFPRFDFQQKKFRFFYYIYTIHVVVRFNFEAA